MTKRINQPLNQTEASLLTNALRAAADLYQQDAIAARAQCDDLRMATSRGAAERLSEQFLNQHRMALELANRIDAAADVLLALETDL